jgi:hypothetical protein
MSGYKIFAFLVFVPINLIFGMIFFCLFLNTSDIKYVHYGEGIILHNKIKHVYRKYSIDENMTPLYSVYADMGIGHDILLYQCHTDVEYRKFMNDLYKKMEK